MPASPLRGRRPRLLVPAAGRGRLRLLGVIANPLDDEALFGALASPACAVTPDTLWLLRARRRASAAATSGLRSSAPAGAGEGEARAAEASARSPSPSWPCCAASSSRPRRLRGRARGCRWRADRPRDRRATGYDLATLMRPGRRGALGERPQAHAAGREYESNEGPTCAASSSTSPSRRGRPTRPRRRPPPRTTTACGS